MFPTLLIRRGKTANGITGSHSKDQLIHVHMYMYLLFLALNNHYLALDYEGSVNSGDINSFMCPCTYTYMYTHCTRLCTIMCFTH